MMRSQVRQRVSGVVCCIMLLWGSAGLRTAAGATAPCTLAALQAVAPADTTLTAVTLVPATGTLPEYCRVDGYVTTPEPVNTVNFRLGLPTLWNGKFYFQGVGGFGGTIGALDAGLVRGYASASTDTGHQAVSTDASWAFNNPAKKVDYGYRGTHVTTVAAQRLTRAFYGHAVQHAYFSGCSNGGRQALMEVQRYPDDYDGVIAGDPSLGLKGFAPIAAGASTPSRIGIYQTLLADRDHYLPATKLPLLAQAVLAACDGKDGLVDGLISDPRQCTFDPASLQCPSGDGPDCLTAGQVETLDVLYHGVTNSAGELVAEGFPMGHEDGPTGWQLWIVGSDPTHLAEQPDGALTFTGTSPGTGDPPLGFAFLNDGLRYLSFAVDDPTYDYRTFNLDTDLPRLDLMATIRDPADPDLVEFKDDHGKLLLYHGWADPALSALSTIRYYEDVVQAIGSARETAAFARLFLVPGMNHCTGGPGPNVFDALTALERWVEQGIAPDQIIASHLTAGVIDRTRPLCPYPQVARYVGTGSIDAAENFTCTPPRPAE
jgi:feruloyl esterase